MRVLVIRGTRFIGAHVVRSLHDHGPEIAVFHRGTTSNPILPDVDRILDPGAEYPITAFPEAVRRDGDAVLPIVAMGERTRRLPSNSFRVTSALSSPRTATCIVHTAG